MIDDDWSVVVFKSKPEHVKEIVVDLYRFIEYLVGVKSLHFLIRDRVDDEVVFSFRILLEQGEKRHIEDTVALKLRNSITQHKFAINPPPNHPLYAYVAWPWRDRLTRDGADKFTLFCNYLSQLSRIVMDMAEQDYFDSKERVELAHVACWMLGCTEYGLLSTKEMHVGYYDRVDKSYHPYLSMPFQKEAT